MEAFRFEGMFKKKKKKNLCSFKYSDLLKMMREILESRSSELLLIKFKSEVSDGPQETL